MFCGKRAGAPHHPLRMHTRARTAQTSTHQTTGVRPLFAGPPLDEPGLCCELHGRDCSADAGPLLPPGPRGLPEVRLALVRLTPVGTGPGSPCLEVTCSAQQRACRCGGLTPHPVGLALANCTSQFMAWQADAESWIGDHLHQIRIYLRRIRVTPKRLAHQRRRRALQQPRCPNCNAPGVCTTWTC